MPLYIFDAAMNGKDLEDIKKIRRLFMKFRSRWRLNKIDQGTAQNFYYFRSSVQFIYYPALKLE